MNDELLAAVERLEPFGPEFGGFLANHGPMVADALIHLGAADAVPDWIERYRQQLELRPDEGQRVVDDDWRRHLGAEALVGDWTAFFRRLLQAADWRDVLVEWWPRLLPGVAASATHGVIRTAHAVRSLATVARGAQPPPLLLDEFARGLAFWAALYQPVVGAPTGDGDRHASEALALLPRLDPEAEAPSAGITGRLRLLDHVAGLASGLDRWRAPDDPQIALDEIVAAAAGVVIDRRDNPIAFCHALTAPAAVRLVLAELPAPLHRPTVNAAWQVSAAIVAAFAAPSVPTDRHTAAPPPVASADGAVAATATETWGRRLATAAVEHGDEHVIKFTEAALREHQRSGNLDLLSAAEVFAGRIAPRA